LFLPAVRQFCVIALVRRIVNPAETSWSYADEWTPNQASGFEEWEMKQPLASFMIAAFLLAGAVGAATFARADDKGGPLHDWMEKHMEPAMEKRDLKALGEALKQSAKFAPDSSWNDGDNSWKKIAEDGAAAAAAGDFKEARKSCKSCHKAWRKEYRAKHKQSPLPK
jgi:hypothetical protein